MEKPGYTFLQSYFTEPIIRGSNTSSSGNPHLQFYRWVERSEGQLTIVIQVHFSYEGMGSNFYFEVISKSLFRVLGDSRNIVAHDIYDMKRKAIEDIHALVDYKIEKDSVSTIGVPMPAQADLLDELAEFVKLLHSNA